MGQRTCYPLSILERKLLNPDSPDHKETYHLVLDLSDSQIKYKAGDCLAIYPHNSPVLVNLFLEALPFSRDTLIVLDDSTLPLVDYLTVHANLYKPSKLLKELAQSSSSKEALDLLRSIDLASLTLEDLSSLFLPQLPRFYSIASSMPYVGKTAHLIVALARNPEGASIPFGTCSEFLCKRAPLNEKVISAYHHPAPHFFLPNEKQTPIVMIGPGTGIAPFRAFLQERIELQSTRENWLFFGEKRSAHDFFYKEELSSWSNQGHLKLNTAFSRDNSEKVYVQHKMMEKSRELWDWIQKGAYLYVCGDAKQMAKAVDQTLIAIIEKEGNLEPQKAKDYLKNMRQQKRYQRDVY